MFVHEDLNPIAPQQNALYAQLKFALPS